jgi:hypothetical protein
MDIAFTELKQRFTSTLILTHFNPKCQSIVETDASDFALSAVISQRQDDGLLRPIAFHSRKFTSAEINSETHDKELLGIVDSFKILHRYLEGELQTVIVFTDHHNLDYFMTTKVLNRRQARWAQELAGIDFKIVYRPGSQNGKPDALSRGTEYRPLKGGNEEQPISTVLQEKHFSTINEKFILAAENLVKKKLMKWTEDFLRDVRDYGKKDNVCREALASLDEKKED